MRKILSVFAIVAMAAGCSEHTYAPRTFSWSGSVAPGATVKIRNIDGPIAIVASTTPQVTLSAVIVNAPASAVQVKQAAVGNDVYFCTLLGKQVSESCGPGERKHSAHFNLFSLFSHRHPKTVRYTLRVPAGVQVDVETVNGRIAGQNIGGDVRAETVNGDVVISTTKGTVSAETVNGSIVASMASLPDSGDVHLETVNGSITSLLPEGIGGSISLENTNGSISANYPNAVTDSSSPHHMRFKLDEGPRRVTIETVNGSVKLGRYVKPPVVSLLN